MRKRKKHHNLQLKKVLPHLVTPDGKVNKEAFKEASAPYKGKVGYK